MKNKNNTSEITSLELAQQFLERHNITDQSAEFLLQALKEMKEWKEVSSKLTAEKDDSREQKIEAHSVESTSSPFSENFKINADGKIEVIKMHKKFSILQADHNGEDILKWEHKDKDGNTGIKWVTYLTGRAAEKECKKQNKKLLKDKAEVQEFISFLPWDSIKEKINNFVSFFNLEKVGYWDSNKKKWGNVDSVGYVKLSEVEWDNDGMFGLRWGSAADDCISRDGQEFASLFFAYEDC